MKKYIQYIIILYVLLPTGLFAVGPYTESNGTVTDHGTGLIWFKKTADTDNDGDYKGPLNRVSWSKATAFCESSVLNNFTDWRLPNIRELRGIVEIYSFSLSVPNTNEIFDVERSHYWSSTQVLNYSYLGMRYYLSLSDGNHGQEGIGSLHYVLCVRGGLVNSTTPPTNPPGYSPSPSPHPQPSVTPTIVPTIMLIM